MYNSRNRSRRDFLKSIAVTAGFGATGQNIVDAQMEQRSAKERNLKERPNIILYVVDDQGTNDAGCYGNKAIKTPGLDSIANEGVVFTHGFCTTASCSASRSVILTGLFNHANGQYGHEHSYHHFRTF